MKHSYLLLRATAALLGAVCLSLSGHAQLTNASPEELHMTAQPEVPGASAVYLDRDEVTDDGIRTYIAHIRIKVLTDEGRKYAEVELPQLKEGSGYSLVELQARTIH